MVFATLLDEAAGSTACEIKEIGITTCLDEQHHELDNDSGQRI
jgi:hypothetical protein